MQCFSRFLGGIFLLACSLCSTPLFAEETSEEYQRRASISYPPESYLLFLKAADLELAEGNESAVQALLRQVPEDPNNSIVEAHKQLLIAELKLKHNDNQGAFTTLENLASLQQLPSSLAERYYTARAISHYRLGQLLESVQDRVLLEPLLKNEPENVAQNRRAIWKNLMEIPLRTLKLARIAPAPDILSGWITLAYITKAYELKDTDLTRALLEWRKTYPNHPANTIVPAPLKNQVSENINQSEHIALLLPLTGPYQSAGEAIRDGFLAAHYGNTLPKKPSTRIYDTTQYASITDLYRQAIAEGANIIVGPLTKEDVKQVAQLSNRDLKVPTIALNALENTRKLPDQLFSFSLQPETDANAVAERVSKEGYHQALILKSSTNSNKRAALAFNQKFSTLGGVVLNQYDIPQQADLGNAVIHLLQIDESQKRALALKKTLGRKIEFQPRRRQDIEVIVLMSSPEQARQLRPLFDFYYAQDLPLYAISSVYEGVPNPAKDRDMNRITFCDMPWILDDRHPLHANKIALQALWGDKMETEARLFAFGLDAYQLTARFNQLSNSPNTQFLGATGTLSIRDNHSVERQLMWARIQNGIPKLI